MLTSPELPTEELIRALHSVYAIEVTRMEFLPLGADPDSASYRAGDWFVKLRRGPHGALGARVAQELFAAGIDAVVAPIPARSGEPWASVGEWRMLVCPFLELTPASKRALTEAQWRELGAVVRRVHEAELTTELAAAVPTVNYAAPWRSELRAQLLHRAAAGDAISEALEALIEEQRARIEALIDRSETLSAHVCTTTRENVVCHTDLHGYNVLTDAANRVRIVDWDEPRRAPRERDLMFIGGGQFSSTHSADEERRMFFAGYGPINADAAAIEYFRRERIVEDLVLFIRAIRNEATPREEREQSLHWMHGNFAPGGTLDAAAR